MIGHLIPVDPSLLPNGKIEFQISIILKEKSIEIYQKEDQKFYQKKVAKINTQRKN